MHTQTHTELTAICLKATVLWHTVGPVPVTGVDRHTQIHTNTHSHIHTSSWVCSCFSAQQQSWKGTMGSNAFSVRTPYSVPQSFLFLDLPRIIPLLLPNIFKFTARSFSQIFFCGFNVYPRMLGGLFLWTWQWGGVKTLGFYRAKKASNGCNHGEGI